jgi:nucleoside-diphosphate-sugar epimerase
LLWPAAALAALGGVALRRAPRLSPGKLRELFHADWVARPPRALALPGWVPRTTFEEGFAQTMTWYRQRRWL